MLTSGESWAMWFLQTGFYLFGLWLVLLLGSALAIWGFIGRGSKGQPCCPKCWYDMRGSTSRSCPECGHDAKTERRLHKRRRCWRLAAVGLLLALLIAWPTSVVSEYVRQQHIGKVLGKIDPDGDVTYELFAPVWLEEYLPGHLTRFFERLIEIRVQVIEPEAFTDTQLTYLKGLNELQSLRLSNTGITDAGLVYLKGLNQLESLELEMTAIAGAGLIHLKDLSELEFLFLSGTGFTDAGLIHLKDLSKLKALAPKQANNVA